VLESSQILATSLVVIFVSGMLQSLSGFGFCLLAVPVITIYMKATEVVPLMIILGIALNGTVAVRARKHVDLRSIWPLVVTGVAFTPLGTWALKTADDSLIKAALGVVICAFAAALLGGLKFRVKREKVWFVPIGALSGFLGGGIAFNGPPVVIYLAATGKEKDSFRARLAGYFLILNLFILPSHIYAGLITTDTLKMAGLSIIPLLAGVWGGIFLAERISEGLFRKVVLLVILASGMASGISGAMSLMCPPG
jgi:uncharacterized membrane protein YfcA